MAHGRSPSSIYIVHLNELTRADVGRAGGKAANLGELLRAGFDIPDGFVLAPAAYEHSLAASDGSLERLDVRIGSLPPDLFAALAATLELFRDVPMAVRSSAVDEDGTAASFAGQHETYLNVRGPAAVAEAIVRCWESARTERALEYRQRHGLSGDTIRLAVLVQRLISADVSAVAFSAHPVTGNRDEIVINATWGLGESLVGGTVTPDTYIVRKSDLTTIDRQVAEKRRMTVLTSGGTREVDVPRLLRAQASLTDQQVGTVARLARDLEGTMGWPVDVECAFQDDRLWLLQCRPITALAR